jgi:hypothetical protein
LTPRDSELAGGLLRLPEQIVRYGHGGFHSCSMTKV